MQFASLQNSPLLALVPPCRSVHITTSPQSLLQSEVLPGAAPFVLFGNVPHTHLGADGPVSQCALPKTPGLGAARDRVSHREDTGVLGLLELRKLVAPFTVS